MITFQEYYELLERIKQLEDKCSQLSSEVFKHDFLGWLPFILCLILLFLNLVGVFITWSICDHYFGD